MPCAFVRYYISLVLPIITRGKLMQPRLIKFDNEYYLIADGATQTFTSGNTIVIDVDNIIATRREELDIKILSIVRREELLSQGRQELKELIKKFESTHNILNRISIWRKIKSWVKKV